MSIKQDMGQVSVDVIYEQDCLTGLQGLPDECIQCCVTSPPYWRLRDYQVEGQLGMEETLEEYVANLVSVFDEVNRVLKPDGTFWLNIGDCYWGSGKAASNPLYQKRNTTYGKTQDNVLKYGRPTGGRHPELKKKDLIGLPWMLAFALRKQGWYLRDCIIWAKPNPMPESVMDRTTKSHEYIFLFSKCAKYYYNAAAIRQPATVSSLKRWSQDIENQKGSDRVPGKTNGFMKAVGGPRMDKQRGHSGRHAGDNDRWDSITKNEQQCFGANKRSVWIIPTQPYKGAHFATFPQALPETCIKAGSRPGDIILDPFMGSGTTAAVARMLGRHYIGFELNGNYLNLARQRLQATGMLAKG